MGLTLTVTILGCCALRMVLISLSDVIGKPSFSFSIFSRFRATISSEKKVTGRQTLRRPSSTQMLPFTAVPWNHRTWPTGLPGGSEPGPPLSLRPWPRGTHLLRCCHSRPGLVDSILTSSTELLGQADFCGCQEPVAQVCSGVHQPGEAL